LQRDNRTALAKKHFTTFSCKPLQMNVILYSRIGNMDLKPQDVVLLLKLVSSKSDNWTFGKLGKSLAMSASHAFDSALRAENSRLLTLTKAPSTPPKARAVLFHPNRANLKEFLIHGVKYSFPVERGGITRGIPTAEGAPPLREQLFDPSSFSPVWPSPDGDVRGTEFSPLYKNVPHAIRGDKALYELLVLVDAIRDGRAREREIAVRELNSRIDLK
jgi:hypothetical protein